MLWGVWVIVALLALLTGCGGSGVAPIAVPAGAQAGDLVGLQACTYEAKEIEYDAECGTLVVPENRSDPDSRAIPALIVVLVVAVVWFLIARRRKRVGCK